MPIYEYHCERCGHEFEREQRITDNPIRTCPECSSRKARRLISRTSFVLKGAGWYSDLYSKPKGGKMKDDTKPKGKEKPGAPSKGGSGESTSGSDSGPKGRGKQAAA